MKRIPPSKWVWCGYPGHFIAADSCRLHLHTRVGDYRISTVGDYHPRDRQEAEDIGYRRKYETYVFRVSGPGEHGEGEVSDDRVIDWDAYNESVDAERGHVEMCQKYAEIATREKATA